jgi:hypothetical protein
MAKRKEARPPSASWKIPAAIISVALVVCATFSRTASNEFNAPISVPSGKIPLGVNWELIPMTGWGTFGENLLEHMLSGRHPFYPLLARKQSFWEWGVLRRLHAEQSALPAWFFESTHYPDVRVGFPILHATSGASFVAGSKGIQAWGSTNIALCFFEVATLEAKAVEYAKQYDLILTGSTFNQKVLTY